MRNSTGLTGAVKLELLVNGAVVGTITENLSVTPASYSWPVGKLLNGWVNPGSDFKVRVSGTGLAVPAGTSYYFYDSNGRLLAEYDQSGACVKDYIYLGSKLLAEYQPSGSKYYYYTSDQINSTRIITNSTGAVVYSAVFDPYGGLQKQWVSTYQPSLKFSGKERETKSELDYFGARYYGHRQYRFLSVDPVINKDEALANPQLWNLYAYCRNNPVSRMDPDGRYVIANSDRMILNIAMMSVTPTGGGIFNSLNNDFRPWAFIDGTNQNGAGGFIDPNIDISKSNGFVTGGRTTIDFNSIANYNLPNASSLRTTGHEASHLQAYSSSSQQTGINFLSAHGTATRQDQGGTNGTFNGPAGLVGQSIQGEFAGMMQNNSMGTSMMVSARAAQMRQTVNQIISFSLSLMGVSK